MVRPFLVVHQREFDALLHPVGSFHGVSKALPTAADLFSARDLVRRFVVSFEPGVYSGEDSKKLVEVLGELKRLSASGLMLAARRVEETHLHEASGHKRAGTWLAGVTGESVGSAPQMLESARSIASHPVIQEAFRSGALSEQKAKEIASAADVRPDQAGSLVRAAAEMGMTELKRHCSDTRALRGSERDEVDAYERIRRRRYLRTWAEPDGSGRLEARVTPDALSVLNACLAPYCKKAFRTARESGRHERHEAYMADALVDMAKASAAGSGATAGAGDPERGDSDRAQRAPKTLVRIRVDLSCLKRGHRAPGETCEIPGVAPVPVAAARELLGDSVLELVLSKGKDVRTVCSDSRHIKRALGIALEERDQTCCVPGCEMSDPLENDHYLTDYSKGGPTRLDNLARLCPYHHDQKTYRGWRLEGGPGNWRFVGPDPPPGSEHPEHRTTRPPGQASLL